MTVVRGRCGKCGRMISVRDSVLIRHLTPPDLRSKGFWCPGGGTKPFVGPFLEQRS